MGSPESEQVLSLLQELAMLKELDRQPESAGEASDESTRRHREQRHSEITEKIKALAEQKKAAEESDRAGGASGSSKT